MLGVILCGGRSSRMGMDKGLLHSTSESWSELASEKLESVIDKIFISVSADQLTEYRRTFSPERLIADQADLAVGGPLLGILSVHKDFPNEDLFILACDLPKMDALVLRTIVSEYQKEKSAEALVVRFKEVEPLCGIYCAAGLEKVYKLCEEGKLARHSMKYVLELLHTTYLEGAEDWKPFFKNVNAPGDLPEP